MSFQFDIKELSIQIALLQEQLQKQIVSTKKRKVKSEPEARTKLRRYIQSLEGEQYDKLCLKYKDEINFIQKREPGWLPPKRFFDI